VLDVDQRGRIKLSMREVAADAGADSNDADDAPEEESLTQE
jgi:predicted RNA-binding protein with RPS1 domain